jgi:hypothetical protein
MTGGRFGLCAYCPALHRVARAGADMPVVRRGCIAESSVETQPSVVMSRTKRDDCVIFLPAKVPAIYCLFSIPDKERWIIPVSRISLLYEYS